MIDLEWRETPNGLKPFMDGQEVDWAPFPGAQDQFMNCPAFEVLFESNRGSGKSTCLIMSFCQHVGKGFGSNWTGVILRQSHPRLSELIKKSKELIPAVWPYACYKQNRSEWNWPSGEKLLFRHMEREEDYWDFHGFELPFIGWDELTTWPSDKCYKVMMSLCRSAHPEVPKMIRSTTNPSGTGHSWVKRRFQLPVPSGRTVGHVISDDKLGVARVAIHGDLDENIVLKKADPNYKEKIKTAARSPGELEAWLHGNWDIVAGGMFDDLWLPEHVIVPDIPFDKIPANWRISRSYDHGSSAPFSVCWWAKSNGEPIVINGRTIGAIPGDRIQIAEWYGWDGHNPNQGLRMLATEIADGIKDRQIEWGIDHRTKPGPADSSIFDPYEPGKTVSGDMARRGIRWHPADKSRGSRIQGWEQVRKLLKGCQPTKGGTREEPGLFFCERCVDAIRLMPVLPRDQKNLDDVDTNAEDHCFAGSTLVITDQGVLPISELTEGRILVPDGTWKEFFNARLTRKNAEVVRIEFSDGSSVVCTPDHKWLTASGEWVFSVDLMDEVCYDVRLWKTRSRLTRQFRNFKDRDTIPAVLTSRKPELDDYIERFGKPILGRSLKDLMYITKMGTRRTIPSKIWSFCQPLPICPCTAENEAQRRSATKLERLRKSGMQAKREELGIVTTTAGICSPSSKRNATGEHVSFAENYSIPLSQARNSALITVEQPVDVDQVRMMWGEYARSAEKTSQSTGMQGLKPVLQIVGISSAGKKNVYCLTVPDAGCFALANGAIVSNCADAIRYYCREKLRASKSRSW